jgi:5-methylcytosine-specific restriction endonuclease McrA
LSSSKTKTSTGSRSIKTRAGGKWSEARFFAFIRSALRRASNKWPVKFDVKNNARRHKPLHKAGRHRFEYLCAACSKWYADKECAVDHIRPVGALKSFDDLPRFVETLFCEEDNLQILCHDCHTLKTARERRGESE